MVKGTKKGKSNKGSDRSKNESFLAENRYKTGVQVTDSGLQYEIIEEGDGDVPSPKGSVTVHQRIKLIDGTVIDDTYKTNTTETFDLSDAIDGYFEGLMMMRSGSRYTFCIPSDLAWGNRGSGSRIGPYATIIIDCRLISHY